MHVTYTHTKHTQLPHRTPGRARAIWRLGEEHLPQEEAMSVYMSQIRSLSAVCVCLQGEPASVSVSRTQTGSSPLHRPTQLPVLTLGL